ncbi:MAG: ethanolamine ammonia-lyase reactivating factor EutA [Pirellulales bacterium]
MPREVQLVGFDFGSTTSSALVATAQLAENSVSRRVELRGVRERFRSEMVFTPFTDEGIDEQALERYLHQWLTAAGVQPEEIFGGGALVTGLAAQQANARAIGKVVRRAAGDALVATADDPCLESWLAFLGSCDALSRAHPQTAFVNLDIGGGTTNLALGQAGQVLRTGCLFVGARHIQVEPGGYRIARLSHRGRLTLEQLGIARKVGSRLTPGEVDAVMDFYMQVIESELGVADTALDASLRQPYRQVAFRLPRDVHDYAVTLSGGVGELVYAHLQGRPWPSTTQYGDLGIDLARRLVDSPRWSGHFRTYTPASGGRATVFGLLRYNTEVSGSTLYLPHPDRLPQVDIPLVGALSPEVSDEQLDYLLGFVRRSPRGGGLFVSLPGADAAAVRTLGQRIAAACRARAFPAEHPIVLLMPENLGNVLGQYATEWGTMPLNLIVIDEIAARDAQYVQIGRLRDQVAPVSFYGLHEASGPD